MKWLIFFLSLFLGSAHAQLSRPGQIAGTNGFAPWLSTIAGNSGIISYTGPGDVLSGWLAYYGLQAFSSATRGNALVNVCNSTGGVDVGCADMVSSASTGVLVPATISGIACPGANCTIKTFYDLSGNSVPITQATIANRATLSSSCNAYTTGNSISANYPCAVFTAADSQAYISTASISQAQPWSVTSVAYVPYTMSSQFGILNSVGANAGEEFFTGCTTVIYCIWGLYDFDGGSNLEVFNSGGSSAFVMTGIPYHRYHGIFNGASSIIYADGFSTNGTTASAMSGTIELGKLFSQYATMNFLEGGFIAGALTTAQQKALDGNQSIRWGINQIYNPGGVGAVSGTPGTIPTEWQQFGTGAAGITFSIPDSPGTEGGVPYWDLSVAGTDTSGTGGNYIQLSPTQSGRQPAAAGQTYQVCLYVKLESGSNSGFDSGSPYIIVNEEGPGGTFLDTIANVNITPTSAALNTQQTCFIVTTSNASIATIEIDFGVNTSNGETVSAEYRLGYALLVRLN